MVILRSNLQTGHKKFLKTELSNNRRAIYRVEYADKKRVAYIAKIWFFTDTDPYNVKDDSINVKHGRELEIDVYKTISSEHLPKMVFNKITEKNEDKFDIQIDDETIILDFSDWRKEKYLGWSEYRFTILIIEVSLDYVIFNDKFTTLSIPDLEQIYKKIIKILYEWNQKYSFCHGDLHRNNVLINDKNEIKLFDFDLSCINYTISDSLWNYLFFEILTKIDKEGLFLFDCYRFYLALYLGNKELFIGSPFNKYFMNTLKYDFETHTKFMVNKEGMFNDLVYFGKLMLNQEKFLKTIKPLLE